MSYKDQIDVAKQLLTKVDIPVLPSTALKLQQLFNESDIPDPKTVETLISSCPLISGELVSLANTPGILQSSNLSETKNIGTAIYRLGNQFIKNYVLGICIKDLIDSNKVKGLSYHSQNIALICIQIAHYSKEIRSDEAYLLGILHDIGTFALVELDSNYGSTFVSSVANHFEIEHREFEQYGTTHSALGYVTCQSWNISNSIAQAILLHHIDNIQSVRNEKLKQYVALIELAHLLAIKKDFKQAESELDSKQFEQSCQILNLEEKDINRINQSIIL
ncbi:MAG: HDOD domain-containing protein [Pseudomonadota bacterium]|nr:HDOD domain-containing protein [Pseudomonadota bacterium]